MKRLLVLLLGVFVSAVSSGQSSDVPLVNWTVPPFTQSSGGITTMTDATPPRVFIGVQPCRLVDTRAGSGFPAGFGPPSLTAGAPRNFDLDNGPCPALPTGIDAYSLNVTVVNTAGPGHLVIYPQGGAQPTVSSINYVAGQTIANAVIVPAGTGGGVTVVAGVSNTDLIIDINGYFSDRLGNPQNFLTLENNSPFETIAAINTSTSCAAACGVRVQTSSGHALYGTALASSGLTYGAAGTSQSTTANSAGVFGQSQIPNIVGNLFPAGVRGQGGGTAHGVLGVSEYLGVAGYLVDSKFGTIEAAGFLGSSTFTDPPGLAPWGVYSLGDLGGSGAKYFVDPHPTDPGKTIAYISLEGPEAGTYFRGRARFQNGIARIPVPEHFRLVTEPNDLTVQITPIGDMATVAVLKIDLEEIVVRASRSVEFSYLVQGIRSTFRDRRPIRGGGFMPGSRDETLPRYLSERQKERLIANGTYNADGTVNMETARRLGWDRVWEERDTRTPQ